MHQNYWFLRTKGFLRIWCITIYFTDYYTHRGLLNFSSNLWQRIAQVRTSFTYGDKVLGTTNLWEGLLFWSPPVVWTGRFNWCVSLIHFSFTSLFVFQREALNQLCCLQWLDVFSEFLVRLYWLWVINTTWLYNSRNVWGKDRLIMELKWKKSNSHIYIFEIR